MGASGYSEARARHRAARDEAYAYARQDAIENGVCGPLLRFADIGAGTLAAWKHTWVGVHPSGAGRWNWPVLVEQLPHRAAVLPIAIWYGGDLCGMALGHASRHRASGVRHTVTLSFVERRPEPPGVALQRQIVALASGAARAYGITVGARRLRLRGPDPNLLWYYRGLGFEIAWKGGRAVYCEQEI